MNRTAGGRRQHIPVNSGSVASLFAPLLVCRSFFKRSRSPTMNQIFAIRCFSRVVETASFTKAADSLGVPKATVSKIVRDLETHVGVRLLQRTTRRLSVSADGQPYFDQTSKLVRDLEDIDTSFGGENGKPRGRIKVDIGGIPARMVVLPRLPEFIKRYPEMTIDFGVGDRAVDLVSENVDCVIRGGPPTELSFVSRLLGSASWTTCATPAYQQGDARMFLEYLIPGEDGSISEGERRRNWVWYVKTDREALDDLLVDRASIRHTHSLPPGTAKAVDIAALRKRAAEVLAPQFQKLVEATTELFVQAILDLAVPQMVFDRVVLVGDAAFVPRPHTASSTSKAASNALELAKALRDHDGDVPGALQVWQKAELAYGQELFDKGTAIDARLLGL